MSLQGPSGPWPRSNRCAVTNVSTFLVVSRWSSQGLGEELLCIMDRAGVTFLLLVCDGWWASCSRLRLLTSPREDPSAGMSASGCQLKEQKWGGAEGAQCLGEAAC